MILVTMYYYYKSYVRPICTWYDTDRWWIGLYWMSFFPPHLKLLLRFLNENSNLCCHILWRHHLKKKKKTSSVWITWFIRFDDFSHSFLDIICPFRQHKYIYTCMYVSRTLIQPPLCICSHHSVVSLNVLLTAISDWFQQHWRLLCHRKEEHMNRHKHHNPRRCIYKKNITISWTIQC